MKGYAFFNLTRQSSARSQNWKLVNGGIMFPTLGFCGPALQSMENLVQNVWVPIPQWASFRLSCGNVPCFGLFCSVLSTFL